MFRRMSVRESSDDGPDAEPGRKHSDEQDGDTSCLTKFLITPDFDPPSLEVRITGEPASRATLGKPTKGCMRHDMAPVPLETGALLGDYEVVSVAGAGGMGVVYRAT